MEEIINVTLEKCVDGDTASFNVSGEVIKFRFLGVDTPESVHPKKKEEAYGKTASEYTCDLLKNAEDIKVEYDKASSNTDKYNRELAWIWVDGELLQKKLIENGYAQVAYIYGDYKYVLNLCANQSEAKAKKLNIWSDKNYEEGYCKTVDITGVSKDITLDTTSIKHNNNSWITWVGIILFILLLIFDQKYRKKVIKKVKKSIDS